MEQMEKNTEEMQTEEMRLQQEEEAKQAELDRQLDEEKRRVQQEIEEAKEREKVQEKAEELIHEVKRFERSVKNYQRFVLRLIIFLILLWILFFNIIGLTTMPSGDMYPRIDSGDMVLFYRLDKSVKAQDIIVLDKVTPDSGKASKTYICRVVAVGGDTVDISEAGRLVVNGHTMVESNIFYVTPQYESYQEFPLTVPEGECFVLADYRNGGTDSRYFGTVKRREIAGTVISILRRNSL